MARKGRVDRGVAERKLSDGTKVWYTRLFHNGKEHWFGSFNTKTKARVFYEDRKKEQREGRLFPEKFQHGGYPLVSEYIDAYLLTAVGKKAYKDQRYFGQWWKARFVGQRLDAITPTAIEAARQELLKVGLTPQRVNRYTGWLRHVLNTAVAAEKLTANPVTKVKPFKEPKGRTRFLTPEEEAKLFKALGPTYAAWARLAILTGMRQAEQFALQWADVDLERGLITLPATKAGDVQYVHLNEEAKSILVSLTAGNQSIWVFPSQNPNTPMNARNFYRRVWLPAMKGTGIEWATWHDLRHTFASRLAMSGSTEGTIASLLRHSTTALVRRYAHLAASHLKQAVETVSAFGQAAGGVPKASVSESNRDGIEMNSPAAVGGSR